MLDGMMCVTYLIKEDIMSTSNRPGVRRTTAEIYANEPGFMASLGKQGCCSKWERQWEPISFPTRKAQGGWEEGAGRQVGSRTCRLCVWDQKKKSKYVMGVSLELMK